MYYQLLVFSKDIYSSMLCGNSAGQLIDPNGNIHMIKVIHLLTYLAELMFLSILFILNICIELSAQSWIH